MSDLAIQIDRLSKRYRLGATRAIGRTFGEMLYDRAGSLWRQSGGKREAAGAFWALRDVSFNVERGEILGIIGHNGSGKSTLLKILSRITDPTEGTAIVRGRLASLLEVGTGFHPELTGRENIYLSGAVMGMRRREIVRSFDQIVEFSGVEKFLDTPVKRYSSGMYVRLAFAVAAHLEADILLIDEVLAVGDASFQRKCLGKMSDVALSGRTVLFVSHNMAAVQNLCGRAVWLNSGRLCSIGNCASIVGKYLTDNDSTDAAVEGLDRFRDGGMKPIIRGIRLLNEADQPTDRALADHALTVEITYEADEALRDPSFGIGIDTADGQRLIFAQTKLQHSPIEQLPPRGTLRCTMPHLPLTTGEYTMSFGVTAGGRKLDGLLRAARFTVEPWDVYGNGQLPQRNHGPVLMDATWTLPGEAAPPQVTMKGAA